MVWWICFRVIVLSFTLGGLLGDNPLLSETRPNTTSLISLLRPCCFVAIESHAQLSDATLSSWWCLFPHITDNNLCCPLTDFSWVAVIALCICSHKPSEHLCPCVPPPSCWLRSQRKADHDSKWFCHFLSPHSRSTLPAENNIHGFKRLLSSLLLSLKKYNNKNSLTHSQIYVNLCRLVMKSLWITLEQCMFITHCCNSLYIFHQENTERSSHWRLPQQFTL